MSHFFAACINSQRQCYTWEIWKRSFILLLRLGLPSTLIRHENRASRKHFSNRRKFKKLKVSFSCGRISLAEFFQRHVLKSGTPELPGTTKNTGTSEKPKMTVLFCFPITGDAKNKMSMLFVYPRITKELRTCYKVYVGKQITLTFYFLHGL